MKNLISSLLFFLAVSITAQAQALVVKVSNNDPNNHEWTFKVRESLNGQDLHIQFIQPGTTQGGGIGAPVGLNFISAVHDETDGVGNSGSPVVMNGVGVYGPITINARPVTWTLTQDATFPFNYNLAVSID